MPGTRAKQSTKNASKPDHEDDVVAFWLKKIFEGIEIMQVNQEKTIEVLKEEQKSLKETVATLVNEVTQLKRLTLHVPPNNGEKEMNNHTSVISLCPIKHELPKYLNSRKMAYYRQIRSSGIAGIYKEFLERDPPFIPNKFREKQMPGETQQQRERMKKLEATKVSYEIERLEEDCSNQQTVIDTAEREANKIICTKMDAIERETAKEQWLSNVKDEEERSRKIWEEKKKFFDSLPDNQEEESGNGSRANWRRPWRQTGANYDRGYISSKFNRQQPQNSNSRNIGDQRGKDNRINFYPRRPRWQQR